MDNFIKSDLLKGNCLDEKGNAGIRYKTGSN